MTSIRQIPESFQSDGFYDTTVFSPSDKPITVSGPSRPWAPDGIYTAKFVGHRTLSFYGARVELIFEIIPSGDRSEVSGRFGMFFAVKRLIGSEGPNGDFEPKGPKSKLAKLVKSACSAIGFGADISLRDFLKLEWVVTLVTPSTDSEGNKIAPQDRYSIISKASPVPVNNGW